MPDLPLPAVDATTIHGWLTAVGITRALTSRYRHVTLHFDERTPIIANGPASITEAAEAALAATVADIPGGGVLPNVAPEYPPPGKGWWRHADQPEVARQTPWGGACGELWQTTLTTTSGLLHPLFAPHAAQTVRGMIAKPGGLLRQEPRLLTQALTGLGLDDRYPGGLWLLRHETTAAEAGDGRAHSQASPGRDWLAINALPWMPAIDDWAGTAAVPTYRRCAVGWRWRRTSSGAHQLVYEWHLWPEPVPTAVIPVLLSRPQYLPGQPIRCGAWCPPRGPHDPRMMASFTPQQVAGGALDDASPCLVTAAEAAQLLGLGSPESSIQSVTGAARKAISRMGVRAVGRRAGRGGESLYSLADLEAAASRRPGQGARTDIERRSAAAER